MAIESKRGCGYRKVGGTYVVSGNFWASCDRLPFPLTVCPCCGEGYRPSRSLREIDPRGMLGGKHEPCICKTNCYICNPGKLYSYEDESLDKVSHYLEWIGGNFYKDHSTFISEAQKLGISRRLKNGVPRGVVVGKSVFYLAHRDILFTKRSNAAKGFTRQLFEKGPGIFMAFVTQRIEHICTQSEFDLTERYEKDNDIWFPEDLPNRIKQLSNLKKRGITLIPVPDDDHDHR